MRIPLLVLALVGCTAPEPAAESGTTPAPSSAWSDTVLARIADASHAIAPSGGGFAAEVPERALRVGFRPGEVAFELGGDTITLAAAGAPSLGDCLPGRVEPTGDCLRELRYPDGQWWRVDERGAEQGWTVVEPADRLTFPLHFSSTRVTVAPDRLTVRGEAGAALHVRALAAWDATGAALDARFEPDSGGARIVVDTRGATFPVTVDPIYTTASWTVHGGESEVFQNAIRNAGDVDGDGYDDAILGIVGHAWVFAGSAAGPAATATTILDDPYSQPDQSYYGDTFLGQVDLDGDGYDDVLVGAALCDGDRFGCVYVHMGSAAGLEVEPALVLEGSTSYGAFGAGFAGGDFDGDGYDDVVIAEPNGSGDYGAAYLYEGSATGLSSTPALTWVGAYYNASFSSGLAVADPNADGHPDLFIGAPGVSGGGKFWLYQGTASGLPATATTTFSGTTGSYGGSLEPAGDINRDGYEDLLVGEYSNDRVSVMYGSASGVSTTGMTTITGDASADRFGSALATGDLDDDGYPDVVVGDPWYGSDVGRVQVYRGGASGVSTSVFTTLTGPGGGSDYGWSLDTGDFDGDGVDDLLSEAYLWELGGEAVGEAYAHRGAPGGLVTTPVTTWTGTTADRFGVSLAGAGDVDRDGYDDVIVGGYAHESYKGGAWLFLGSAAGLSTVASTELVGEAYDDRFGSVVVGAGDVDGDGYDDVVVTAPGTGSSGKAYLFRGSATGLGSTYTSRLTGTANSDYGSAAAAGCDINRDGHDDLVVGGYSYSSNKGLITVYLGSSSGFSSGTITYGPSSGYYFGEGVGLSDVNADGYCDVFVGAPGYSSATGRVYEYMGSASGMSTSSARTLTGAASSYSFGQAITGAGDMNGDGYDDVLIAAPGRSTHTGIVYLYTGSASAIGASYTGAVGGSSTYAYFGGAMAAVGDLDGDGYDDVVIGNSGGSSTVPGAKVYRGSSSGIGAGTSLTSGGTDDYFGMAVGGAGDVDGDGYPEVLVGAYKDTTYTGVAYLYAGYTTDPDNDGDGYAGSVDCDDTNPAVHPGATEVCDAGDVDEDCDGLADDADTSASGKGTYYADADGDGAPGTAQAWCDPPSGVAASATDCDDGNAAAFPGATEVCDAGNVDEDCDGLADDADSAAAGKGTYYADSDADAYGAGAALAYCDAPTGVVTVSGDCDDTAAAVHPGATEVCDAGNVDEDCDGLADDADSAAAGKGTYYADSDADAYGAGAALAYCDAPTGVVTVSGDCDDTAAAVHPGATEVCDAGNVDEDCDGLADDADSAAAGKGTYYADSDADAYGAGAALAYCDAPTGVVTVSGDCDDTAAAVHPGATEVCDGADNDCDGTADIGAVDAPTWYADADGDRYGDAGSATVACTAPSGAVADATDCDDTDAATFPGAPEVCTDPVDRDCDGASAYADADADGTPACEDCDDGEPRAHPGATEVCDGIDDDCDGTVDVGAVDATSWYPDGDADGYGSPGGATTACDAPAGTVADATDCDDGDAATHPGAPESCDAAVDRNCDGSVAYADADADGTPACEDCDDGDARAYPGAPEVCDGIDDDCDGTVDVGASDATDWYADVDADGYGTLPVVATACEAPSGTVADATDCDDADGATHPGAAERCDEAVDRNCDGSMGYADGDGDGVPACEDCDDGDADVFPGATEVCNGADDDCEGTVDVGAADAPTWYADGDGDGFGDEAVGTVACEAPPQTVADATDCDDDDAATWPGAPEDCTVPVDRNCDGALAYADDDADGAAACEDCDDGDPAAFPGATEVCDGVDDDCDGTIDVGAVDATSWYADADGDGYGDPSTASTACDPAEGQVADATDCDDGDAAVNPDAAEVCNGLDDDCDPATVEAACDTGGDTGVKEAESCGCGSASPGPGAGLLLVGLLIGLRRRR